MNKEMPAANTRLWAPAGDVVSAGFCSASHACVSTGKLPANRRKPIALVVRPHLKKTNSYDTKN